MGNNHRILTPPFWVVWSVELWERFGYYGMQAVISLYFVQQLGYTAKESFAIFGVFFSFCFGFVWLGGKLGDTYFGAKRTLLLGAIILAVSYMSLGFANPRTVFYAMAGIVMGNALFKANPASLISKLYDKGNPAIDSAMTMYYMAINIGEFMAAFSVPFIIKYVHWGQYTGWTFAFLVCGLGLVIGVLSYLIFYHHLDRVGTEADALPFQWRRLVVTLLLTVIGFVLVAELMEHATLADIIIYLVVIGGLCYYIYIALQLPHREKVRMLISALLIFQGFVFFTLYAQLPTSILFLAKNNVHNMAFGYHIQPTSYYLLNSITIIIMSPILAWIYKRVPGTHITKFAIGMTLCASAFLVFWIPRFYNDHGMMSPVWIVVTYYLQSTGELLVSGLGLAMVAELCPKECSGLVMGIWYLCAMLAGPVAGFIGGLTTPNPHVHHTVLQGLMTYTDTLGTVGIIVAVIALVMWVLRPYLNRAILAN